MGYPPPPPPPGGPGHPPQTPGGYGAPPPSGASWPQTGPMGYPPAGPPGGPPPGYAPGPAAGSGGGGNKSLILLMSALVIVVLLVVVGALVLVLADGESDVELTQSQREDALLTDGDIGEGFTVDADEDDDDPDSDTDDRPDASQECLDVLDELEEEGDSFFDDEDADADDSVSRTFTREDDGATIEHSVGIDDGVIDTYRDVATACDEVRFEDETGSSAIRFEEGPEIDGVDYVLDIEFDFAFADDGGSITYGGRIALWTVRGNAAFVLITDGFDYEADPDVPTAIPYDEDLFEDVVATADDKLREVIDEA